MATNYSRLVTSVTSASHIRRFRHSARRIATELSVAVARLQSVGWMRLHKRPSASSSADDPGPRVTPHVNPRRNVVSNSWFICTLGVERPTGEMGPKWVHNSISYMKNASPFRV